MVEELITIEQLERVKRLIQGENYTLAVITLETMIEAREKRVAEFEEDQFDNVPI